MIIRIKYYIMPITFFQFLIDFFNLADRYFHLLNSRSTHALNSVFTTSNHCFITFLTGTFFPEVSDTLPNCRLHFLDNTSHHDLQLQADANKYLNSHPSIFQTLLLHLHIDTVPYTDTHILMLQISVTGFTINEFSSILQLIVLPIPFLRHRYMFPQTI